MSAYVAAALRHGALGADAGRQPTPIISFRHPGGSGKFAQLNRARANALHGVTAYSVDILRRSNAR